VNVKSHLAELFSPSARAELEGRLQAFIEPRRWFRSKTRAVASASLASLVALPVEGKEVFLTVMRVAYEAGPDEEYVVPLTWVIDDTLPRTKPHLVVGAVQVEGEARPRWLIDALGEPHALEAILALAVRGAVVPGEGCELAFRKVGDALGAVAEPRPVETEQSNTSVIFGNDCILKVVRKLDVGRAPDLEMGEHLTRAGYANTPRLLAAIELARGADEPATVGVVHAFVPNQGDAWTFALGKIRDASSPDVAFVKPLAARVAEMHAALAAPTTDPRFATEPMPRAEREALGRAVEGSLVAALALAEARSGAISSSLRDRLRALHAAERALRAAVTRFVDVEPCQKTRVHGDLHLGQVLVTADASGDDFVVIDFEGEPARSLAERKAKRSPMVDVAGMLRSLDYASVAAGGGPTWYAQAKHAFLDAYFAAADGHSVLPEDAAGRRALERFFTLEKCVYELHYELNNRPDWVAIPVEGLETLLKDSLQETDAP
jgi:trehalose synthase-fused probable maltokinase